MSIASLYRGETIIRIAFFAAMLAGGASLCSFAVADYAKARASVSWPTVEGVMLDDPERGGRYAYSWQGRNYEGRRRRFFTGTKVGGAHAPPIAPGDYVPVYVFADNPSTSVLQPGGARNVFAFLLGAGAVLMFFGGGGLARNLTVSGSGPEIASQAFDEAPQQFYDR